MAASSLRCESAAVNNGRRKDDETAAMYAAYQSGMSLSEVGAQFGMTRQSVFGRFRYHGLEMRSTPRLDAVEFNGNRYTLNKNGYLRRTDGDRELLHRDTWKFHHGAIPDGWDVHHKDENKLNNHIDNLECIPKPDHTRLHNPQRQTGKKFCIQCGCELRRKVRPSRTVEGPAAIKKRSFCGTECAGKWRQGKARRAKVAKGVEC